MSIGKGIAIAGIWLSLAILGIAIKDGPAIVVVSIAAMFVTVFVARFSR